MRWVGRVHPWTDDSTVVGDGVVGCGGRMKSVDGRHQNCQLILDGVPEMAFAAVEAVLLVMRRMGGGLHLRACFGDAKK